jgi:hypothetical protein
MAGGGPNGGFGRKPMPAAPGQHSLNALG